MTYKKTFDLSVYVSIEKKNKIIKENYRKKKLKETIAILKEYFSDKDIKKLYIFGSIVKAYMFDKNSDIDIAVEGMKPDEYYKIFGDLEILLKNEKIDLMELETCSFKDLIIKYGKKIL